MTYKTEFLIVQPLLKNFIYSLSDKNLCRWFISSRKDMPHKRLQELVAIDYTKEMAIVATIGNEENQEIIGAGRCFLDKSKHSAEVAFAVRNEYHNIKYWNRVACIFDLPGKEQGLLRFTADVLAENKPIFHVFENGGFNIVKHNIAGIYGMTMAFKE